MNGSIQPVGVPAKALAIDELASRILTFGSRHMPVEGHGRSAQTPAPQAAAHLSHVRVDPETGGVTVLARVVAQDVGRALNPALVEGQMQGGTAQGLGWALLEELAHDDHGQLTTGTFVDYAMPTADSTPPIDAQIVEVPAPEGPYGAVLKAYCMNSLPSVSACPGRRARRLMLSKHEQVDGTFVLALTIHAFKAACGPGARSPLDPEESPQ